MKGELNLPGDRLVTVVLGSSAILIPATVTIIGHWIKSNSDARLDQDRDQVAARLLQEHREEEARLRLDAAMRAARLFAPTDNAPASPTANASELLALPQFGRAIWPSPPSSIRGPEGTAIMSPEPKLTGNEAVTGADSERRLASPRKRPFS